MEIYGISIYNKEFEDEKETSFNRESNDILKILHSIKAKDHR